MGAGRSRPTDTRYARQVAAPCPHVRGSTIADGPRKSSARRVSLDSSDASNNHTLHLSSPPVAPPCVLAMQGVWLSRGRKRLISEVRNFHFLRGKIRAATEDFIATGAYACRLTGRAFWPAQARATEPAVCKRPSHLGPAREDRSL
jgi:hypothetical protein